MKLVYCDEPGIIPYALTHFMQCTERKMKWKNKLWRLAFHLLTLCPLYTVGWLCVHAYGCECASVGLLESHVGRASVFYFLAHIPACALCLSLWLRGGSFSSWVIRQRNWRRSWPIGAKPGSARRDSWDSSRAFRELLSRQYEWPQGVNLAYISLVLHQGGR